MGRGIVGKSRRSSLNDCSFTWRWAICQRLGIYLPFWVLLVGVYPFSRSLSPCKFIKLPVKERSVDSGGFVVYPFAGLLWFLLEIIPRVLQFQLLPSHSALLLYSCQGKTFNLCFLSFFLFFPNLLASR